MHKSFLERINFIVGERPRNPWGESIGLSRGVVYRMFNNGTPPGPTSLGIISRAENVRTDWLIEGRGSPFHCTAIEDAAELWSYLNNLLQDEPWRVHVVEPDVMNKGAERPSCIVLEQPGRYETKRGWIDYTILEVITGDTSAALRQLLEYLGTHEIVLDRIPLRDYEALTQGQLGSYRLFGWGDRPGLLQDGSPVSAPEQVAYWFARPGKISHDQLNEAPAHAVEEMRQAYRSPSELSDEEQRLVKMFRRLRPQEREAILVICNRLSTEVWPEV